jgi:hypothetical protein
MALIQRRSPVFWQCWARQDTRAGYCERNLQTRPVNAVVSPLVAEVKSLSWEVMVISRRGDRELAGNDCNRPWLCENTGRSRRRVIKEPCLRISGILFESILRPERAAERFSHSQARKRTNAGAV